MLVYIRPLIMMREYDRTLSESGLGLCDTLFAILVLQSVETIKCYGFCLHGCSIISSKQYTTII